MPGFEIPTTTVWTPEQGYPRRGITVKKLFKLLQRKRGNFAEEVKFQRETPISPDFPESKSFRPRTGLESVVGTCVTMNRVRGTENILREEAHHLGFNAVVIPSGPPNKHLAHLHRDEPVRGGRNPPHIYRSQDR